MVQKIKIITFVEVDKNLLGEEYIIENFSFQNDKSANIVILDINTIFDYEENKHKICQNDYISLAIIEDNSEYEAFKNFGIDAWIKSSDISQIHSLLELIKEKLEIKKKVKT